MATVDFCGEAISEAEQKSGTATEIVRRIDDLDRVVIPKGIRFWNDQSVKKARIVNYVQKRGCRKR